MSSFGKFVAGTLIGASIGAVIGVLVAPRSGKETRRRLKRDVAHRYEATVDAAKDQYEETVGAAADAADKVMHTVDESIQSLEAKADALKSQIKQITEDLEEVGRKTVSKIGQKADAK